MKLLDEAHLKKKSAPLLVELNSYHYMPDTQDITVTALIEGITRKHGKFSRVIVIVPEEQALKIPTGAVDITISPTQNSMFDKKQQRPIRGVTQ